MPLTHGRQSISLRALKGEYVSIGVGNKRSARSASRGAIGNVGGISLASFLRVILAYVVVACGHGHRPPAAEEEASALAAFSPAGPWAAACTLAPADRAIAGDAPHACYFDAHAVGSMSTRPWSSCHGGGGGHGGRGGVYERGRTRGGPLRQEYYAAFNAIVNSHGFVPFDGGGSVEECTNNELDAPSDADWTSWQVFHRIDIPFPFKVGGRCVWTQRGRGRSVFPAGNNVYGANVYTARGDAGATNKEVGDGGVRNGTSATYKVCSYAYLQNEGQRVGRNWDWDWDAVKGNAGWRGGDEGQCGRKAPLGRLQGTTHMSYYRFFHLHVLSHVEVHVLPHCCTAHPPVGTRTVVPVLVSSPARFPLVALLVQYAGGRAGGRASWGNVLFASPPRRNGKHGGQAGGRPAGGCNGGLGWWTHGCRQEGRGHRRGRLSVAGPMWNPLHRVAAQLTAPHRAPESRTAHRLLLCPCHPSPCTRRLGKFTSWHCFDHGNGTELGHVGSDGGGCEWGSGRLGTTTRRRPACSSRRPPALAVAAVEVSHLAEAGVLHAAGIKASVAAREEGTDLEDCIELEGNACSSDIDGEEGYQYGNASACISWLAGIFVLFMRLAAFGFSPPTAHAISLSRSVGQSEKRRRRRAATAPLWTGTSRWAIEGVKVGRARSRRARATGWYRALRLGTEEWWRRGWQQLKDESRRASWDSWGDVGPYVDAAMPTPGAFAYGNWPRHRRGNDAPVVHDPCRGTLHPNSVTVRPNASTFEQRASHRRRGLIGYGRCRRVVVLVMAAALAGIRIGEAPHPGYGLQDPHILKLREATLEGEQGKRLSYADPDKMGFWGGKSPGFQKEDLERRSGARRQRAAQLAVESANVTGPAGLRTRLRSTRADVLLAQETWATEEAIPDLRDWAKRQRWVSIWAPAKAGVNGGRPSGGVAIFVRDHLGLREPDSGGPVWRQHRACAGVVEVPGYRPTICVAAYFHSGDEWGNDNVALMASICAGVEAQGKVAGRIRPTIVGVDANMTPEDFMRSEVGEKVGLQIVRPPTARGTFRTRTSARCIDFFLTGGGMSEVVEEITTVEASGITGHSPVQVTFQPRATGKKCLVARLPPKIPTERIYGPLPPPPCYKEAIAKAEIALAAAKACEPRLARQRKLDEAYASLANAMEAELCDITGTKLPTWGKRAENPRIVWRSVLHERQAELHSPRAAYPKWAKGIALELIATDKHRERMEKKAAGGNSRGRTSRTQHDDVVRGHGLAALAREREVRRAISEGPPDGTFIRDASWGAKLAELGRSIPGAPLGENGGTTNAAPRGEWRRSAEQLVETLHAEGKRAEEEERQEGIAKWRAWLRDDLDRGGRNAHAFSRLPQQWRPATTRPADWREEEYDEDDDDPSLQRPQISAAPWNLLDDKRNALELEWDGAPDDFVYDWGHWEEELARSPGVHVDHRRELPSLDGDGIKSAAMSFKASTSSTFDGFHVRHFGMVCDAARNATARILDAVEAGGIWPTQVALVITPMIPKAKGGFRVIGAMPSLYRVWAKARREVAVDWERKHQRCYYAASPGIGPVDVVWAQAARQEAGAAKGEVAGMILEDLASFYEGINRDLLATEAAHLGFPVQLLRGSVGMYANPRLVALNGRVARQVHPRRGVIAGCAFATTYVKVLMTRALDRAMANMPAGVMLDAYIDDLALSVVGSRAQVVDKLAKAHDVLRAAIQHELGCSFAQEKTAVVATCAHTARLLKEAVGAQGRILEAAPNLGIDAPAAKARGAWHRSSLRRSRLVQAARRERRLAKLSAAVGPKATRIFKSGAEKAGTYGAEVWGLNDSEVKKLRRLAAATVRPKGRGRSLTLALLLAGAPTAAAEVLAVQQYHRVVWKGVTQRDLSRLRGTTLGAIDTWFKESRQYAEQLVDDAGYDLGTCTEGAATRRQMPEGPQTHLARDGAAAAWRKVRGPIAAAHLTLARLGWRFNGPFEVQDERGYTVQLTQTSPSLLKDLLIDGVRRRMERKVGEAWGRRDPAFRGRRVCVDVALRHMRASKNGLTKKQIGAYRSGVCGAIMTNSRAAEEGYLVQNICPLCGEHGDTIHHRVYHCPKTREAVEAAVPAWFLKEARSQAASCRYWTTAILPHPGDLAPPPPRGWVRGRVGVFRPAQRSQGP